MAEGGFLQRFLGGGEGEEVGEGEAALPGSDPLISAAALEGARYDPDLSRKLGSYVEKQAHLVEIQTEHLHEQREVQLSHLKLRRFTDRLKAGTQLFIILVATVIGFGVALMLYDAFTSQSVVVDAFKAPSALAGRGVTGDVVAAGVLDTLQKLQDATRSPTQGLNAHGAWAGDVKIEVPETGVSLGEINRLLHERFGHDLHISGDLVQTDTGGLALTVREDGVPASTITGGPGDLDKLTTQAAEYIYGHSQPSRYATYLENSGRNPDAVAFLRGAFARANTNNLKASLALIWGNAFANMNDMAPAAHQYRVAMSLAPPGSKPWWKGWANFASAQMEATGEEAAWRESQAFLAAASKVPESHGPDRLLLAEIAQVTRDLPLELSSLLSDASRNNGAGTDSAIDGPQVADVYWLMHDQIKASQYIAGSDPDDPTTKAEALLLQGYTALGHGDAAEAVPPLEAFYKAWLADAYLQNNFADQPCFLGLAYGLAGRTADAENVFKRAVPWSRCYALHGETLAHTGDVAGAQRVWAEGVRLLPDLPNVYLARGRWEMDHDDFNAASADLAAASAKAPHYADPLKVWGDVLAKEGLWKAALAKYDEALKYAPAWTELHHVRDAAAHRT